MIFPGFGTVINVSAIVIGGLGGLFLRRFLVDSVTGNLIRAVALCCLFIGIEGALSQAFSFNGAPRAADGALMVIGSFCIGSLIGAIIGIEDGLEHFGEWLKTKTGSASDGMFVRAFVTSSLTVSIGAMAVVGALRDGIAGDVSILAAKSVMDLVIIMVMTASMGRGCIFSCLPVAVLQGFVTLLAVFIEPYLTERAVANLSLVGSMMIFCVGVNLIWGKQFRVADMLPGLIIAMAWAFF